MAAVKSAKKSGGASTPTTIPGREFREVIPPRSPELVKDYIRNVGGDPGAYRGQLPAHLFPQWVFPLQARGLEDVNYPMHKVLNGGCRIEFNGPLPMGEALSVSCRLEGIDDDGKRAIIHQRAVTGTAQLPEAVVTHVYAFVPLSSKGKKDEKKGPPKKKAAPPRVPEDAREIAFWSIPASAGLDFAKLTGDFNPIHWIPPAARAAGFKNVILHGFATLARAIEGMNRALFAGDTSRLATIDVRFTRPLVLPAKVGLYVRGDEVFVGTAKGGPANLVGTFTTR
jgi:acyl dehydratase